MRNGEALRARLRSLARVLGAIPVKSNSVERLTELVIARARPSDEHSYLVVGVLSGQIPEPAAVRDFTRQWRTEGSSVVRNLVRRQAVRLALSTTPVRAVEITDAVVVDVTDTGSSDFTTGIQRVARETISRWSREHRFVLASWSRDKRTLHHADDVEARRASLGRVDAAEEQRILIPYRATVVLPEIAVDQPRALRLQTLARFSGSHAFAIGFDCIPITTAETAGAGMPGAFSKYLAALSWFDRVAAISSAAAVEFDGWRNMLAGAGIQGPTVVDVTLPATTGSVDSHTAQEVRSRLELADQTIVLAVGSHEPRKNHVRLLHAAEKCWSLGLEFTLVFVGGNAWGADRFNSLVDELRGRGRSIVVLSKVDDDTVWSLYRLARFSVFCSINEGFGLPVVESLASGTPVVTSDFGSMRELGEGFGALLVDPKDTAGIAEGMRSLLADDALLAGLEEQSRGLPERTWDDYAREIWAEVELVRAHPAPFPAQ